MTDRYAAVGLADAEPGVAEVIRGLTARHVSRKHLREVVDGLHDDLPELWQALQDGGWNTLEVPGNLGGAGVGRATSGLVAMEIGYALGDANYTASVMVATPFLLAAPRSETALGLLCGIVAGQDRAVVVSDLAEPSTPRVRAHRSGGSTYLSGQVPHVLGAVGANALLVHAQLDGTSAVVHVPDPGEQRGSRVTPEPALDRTRRLAHVELDEVRVPDRCVLAAGTAADEMLEVASERLAFAVACDSVGTASRALELTVEYAKTRRQFGREIGSFQAVKHHCADMLVDLRMSNAMVEWSVEEADGDSTFLAKRLVTAALDRIAGNAMQVHGGIGFTWDLDIHLMLRRAKLNQLLGRR